MTTRERFIRTMNFEPVDRLPMLGWATWWDKTIDHWKGEGLVIRPVPDLTDGEALYLQLGLDIHMQAWIGFTTADTPAPAYHGAPIVTSMEEYETMTSEWGLEAGAEGVADGVLNYFSHMAEYASAP